MEDAISLGLELDPVKTSGIWLLTEPKSSVEIAEVENGLFPTFKKLLPKLEELELNMFCGVVWLGNWLPIEPRTRMSLRQCSSST